MLSPTPSSYRAAVLQQQRLNIWLSLWQDVGLTIANGVADAVSYLRWSVDRPRCGAGHSAHPGRRAQPTHVVVGSIYAPANTSRRAIDGGSVVMATDWDAVVDAYEPMPVECSERRATWSRWQLKRSAAACFLLWLMPANSAAVAAASTSDRPSVCPSVHLSTHLSFSGALLQRLRWQHLHRSFVDNHPPLGAAEGEARSVAANHAGKFLTEIYRKMALFRPL